jgi:hypothetical protein
LRTVVREICVLKSWYDLAMLNMEAQQVIALRMMKLAMGGAAGKRESHLMVSEKMIAGALASAQAMTGASSTKIIKGYRRKVKANRRRLLKG